MEFQCKDPCRYNNPCGSGADCKATGHKAICSCPRGFTGDPFVSCRKFERADLCSPNPCGPGAECTPGFDNNGNDKPVCTCPRGYRGDPLTSCNRGETRTKKKKTKLKFTSVDFFQANAIAIPTVPLTVAATTSAARILATGGREARAAASLPSAGSLDMVSNWQRFKGCNFCLRNFFLNETLLNGNKKREFRFTYYENVCISFQLPSVHAPRAPSEIPSWPADLPGMASGQKVSGTDFSRE